MVRGPDDLMENVMAHEIETTAYFGARPWHGLGTALQESDLYDWPQACKKAGLDWEVELVPLVTADTQAKVDNRAVRRTSDGRLLGVVVGSKSPLAPNPAYESLAARRKRQPDFSDSPTPRRFATLGKPVLQIAVRNDDL